MNLSIALKKLKSCLVPIYHEDCRINSDPKNLRFLSGLG